LSPPRRSRRPNILGHGGGGGDDDVPFGARRRGHHTCTVPTAAGRCPFRDNKLQGQGLGRVGPAPRCPEWNRSQPGSFRRPAPGPARIYGGAMPTGPRAPVLLINPPVFVIPHSLQRAAGSLSHSSAAMAERFLFRSEPFLSPDRRVRPSPHLPSRGHQRRRILPRPLRLGSLCSPPLDNSVRNFSFPEMRDSIVVASTNPNIVHSVFAVVGDLRRQMPRSSQVW